MDRDTLQVISHGILAGTGIYCWLSVKSEGLICPHITYGIITINNIVAIVLWLRMNEHLYRIYRFLSFSQLLFALPGITTTVWLQTGYHKDWSWAWMIVPLFPLLCYLINADMDMPLAELLILFNLIGLGAVSAVKEIKYGIGSVIAYAVSHFLFGKETSGNTILYNLGLAVFAYLSVRTIGYGEDIA